MKVNEKSVYQLEITKEEAKLLETILDKIGRKNINVAFSEHEDMLIGDMMDCVYEILHP